MQPVTLASIRADAERASKEHSWYKHLKWPSTTCTIGFEDAATIRKNTPGYTGPAGTRLVVIARGFPRDEWAVGYSTTIELTPLFRGVEDDNTRYAYIRFGLLDETDGYKALLAERGVTHTYPTDATEIALWREEHARMIDLIVTKATALAEALGLLLH